MGKDHGGLLHMALAAMPEVVMELDSLVDVSRTFYDSKSRHTVANSIKCDLTNLGVALAQTKYLPEEGAALGISTDQNMFCMPAKRFVRHPAQNMCCVYMCAHECVSSARLLSVLIEPVLSSVQLLQPKCT